MKMFLKEKIDNRRIVKFMGLTIFFYTSGSLRFKKSKEQSDLKLQNKLEKKSKISRDYALDEKSNVIVSLTSFGERVKTVHIAIESILSQNVKPKKIILWLDENEFNESSLPEALLQQKKRGLDIFFCDNIKSYKKLIPSLKLFPSSDFVTADDDVMYPKGWLKGLILTSKKYPKTVICYRGVNILLENSKNKAQPYQNWPLITKHKKPGFGIFPTGVSGILYPAKIFCNEVLNQDVFMEICPTGDDIWFKAMAVKNGIKSYVIPKKSSLAVLPPFIHKTQDDGLWKTNVKSENNIQFDRVFNKYNLWDVFG